MTALSPADVHARSGLVHRRWAAGALAVLAVAACALAVAGVADGPAGAVRAVATVSFLLLGPGWVVAGYLRDASPALRWSVAFGVGFAVGAVGGTAMARLGLWQPVGALVLVALLCLPALVRHAVRAR